MIKQSSFLSVENVDRSGEQRATPSRRSNLPLPRELRDQIWGYLLHHKHVHDIPYCDKVEPDSDPQRTASRAHTFRFHVAVLLVNHEVSEEAFEVLNSNDFVVVSYKFPLQPRVFHLQHVPIVCERASHLARIKQHVLRIHLQGSRELQETTEIGEHKTLHALCIISADLPVLCRAIQYLFYTFPPITQMVVATDSSPDVARPLIVLESGVPASKFIRIHLEFERQDISQDAARKILQPFRRMILGGQRVRIEGYPRILTSQVRYLTEIMAPKQVWLNAMLWDILEFFEANLDSARLCLEAGDSPGAFASCSKLGLPTVLHVFDVPNEVYYSSAGVPLALLCFALLDTTVTVAMLRISFGFLERGSLMKSLTEVSALVKCYKAMPNVVWQKLSSLLAGSAAGSTSSRAYSRGLWLVGLLGLMLEENIEEALPICHNFSKELQPVLKGNAHFEHDFKLVTALLLDRKMRSDWIEDGKLDLHVVQLMSLCTLRLQVYHEPISGFLQKPDGLEGFVDTASLARLHAQYPGRYDDLQ